MRKLIALALYLSTPVALAETANISCVFEKVASPEEVKDTTFKLEFVI